MLESKPLLPELLGISLSRKRCSRLLNHQGLPHTTVSLSPCFSEVEAEAQRIETTRPSHAVLEWQGWDSIQVQCLCCFLEFLNRVLLTFCVGLPHTGQEVWLAKSKLSHGNNQKLPMRFRTLPPSRRLPQPLQENHCATRTSSGSFQGTQGLTQRMHLINEREGKREKL